MLFHRTIVIAALLLTAGTLPCQAQLHFKSPSASAAISEGAGAVSVEILNDSASAVPLKLLASPVIDDASRVQLTTAKVDFLPAVGDKLPAAIPPGQSALVIVRFSGLAGYNSVHTTIFEAANEKTGPLPLGEVSAGSIDAPLKVAVEGDGTADRPLDAIRGRTAILTLRNSSTHFLDLNYELRLGGGSAKAEKAILIAPNAALSIPITFPDDAFSWTDGWRSSTRKAQLVLTAHATLPDSNLRPAISIPVTLTTMTYSPEAMRVRSTILVVILLLIGAILSLLGNSVLPNIVTKVGLNQRMAEIANRTSSVSVKIDSYLRVLLRLERMKIDVDLRSIHLFSLTSVELLQGASTSLDRLEKRLLGAERLDELRRKLEANSEIAPPSVIEELDKILQLAADQLHSFFLPDQAVAAAKAFMDQADQKLALIADNDAMAKIISANLRQLKTRLASFEPNSLAPVKKALWGLFTVLDHDLDDPTNLVRPMFFATDHAIAAIHLALDYIMVHGSVAKDYTCADPQKETVKQIETRIKSHECELFALLGTLSWKSLSEATLLIQQMRENIYQEDILEEIENQRARIAIDTQRARPYLPVFFSICFDNNRFNGAAAVNSLSFSWVFCSDLTESGPKVCHYFEGKEVEANEEECRSAHTEILNIHQGPADPNHPGVQDHPEWKSLRTIVSHRLEDFTHGSWTIARNRRVAIKVSVVANRLFNDPSRTPVQPAALATPPQPAVAHPLPVKCLTLLYSRPSPQRSRVWAEAMRMGIALGVALAGLTGGALTQLAKLDFATAAAAIIGIGFSADTVKNLFTKAAKQ